jgi:hypothetical protein
VNKEEVGQPIRMLQLLLLVLGLNIRPMTGLPQSIVATTPPPLRQAFASDLHDVARSGEVSGHGKAGTLCSLAAVVSTAAMRLKYWVQLNSFLVFASHRMRIMINE